MEEYIAKTWANYIEKKSDTGQYSSVRVYFKNQKRSLQLFYYLFGGIKSKELKITDKRPIIKTRTLFEKIAGIGKNFVLCWQDDTALYLPESLAYFPSKELNELHYIWLVGMLCHLKSNIYDVRKENLYIVDELTKQFIKFKNFYNYAQQYLDTTDDESVNPLWIYPPLAKNTLSSFDADDIPKQKNNDKFKNETLEPKKQINKSDDNKADGMLIFLPDSPASFMELVNVDRAQDDSFDEDALENAKDLDEISLSKKQANLAARVKMDLNAINDDFEVYFANGGHYIDEWDYKQEKYLNNYVHINPSYPQDVIPVTLPKRLVKTVKKIQNDLDLMYLERTKITNLSYGDDINLDKWIEYKSSSQKSSHTQRFYESFEKTTRDIATFILADVSLSTETGITQDMRVIDVIKDSLMVFSEALKRLEDRFAIYTFSSLRNKNVYFQMVKHFRHSYNNLSRGRINSITPGYYTRMGAAIRESLSILKDEKTEKKLLLIISDGKPNDIDRYDGKYGIEDTKQAIIEAKKQGVVPFCITIDTQAKSYLSYIFGHNNYAVVRDSKKLPQILPELYINLTK